MKKDSLASVEADHSTTIDAAEQAAAPKHRLAIIDAYLQNQSVLRSYISRFLVSSHEIDDVSQETFLRAYNAEKKKVIDEPKAFLFRIAKNLMLSELKKTSRKVTDYIDDIDHYDLLDEGLKLEDDIMAQQKLGIYCEAVASLPPKRRKVVLMKKVYGMSHKEIAQRMGTTVSAVEKHLLLGGKACLGVIANRYPEHAAGKSAEKSRETLKENRGDKGVDNVQAIETKEGDDE